MYRYRSIYLRSEDVRQLLEEELSDLSELDESDDDLEQEIIEESDHKSESEQEVSDCESNTEGEIRECFVGKDKTTTWYKTEYSKHSKSKQKNIVKILPGPTRHARNTVDEVSTFLKIIDLYIIDEIVLRTNAYIDKKRDAME